MVFHGRAKINSHKLETRSLRRDEVLVRASTSFSTAFLKSAGEMRERRERRPGSAAAAAAMATAATDRCCLRGLSSGTIRREEYIFLLWRNCNCDPSRGQSPSGVMIMSLSQRLISQNRCRRDRSIDCPLHDTKRPILKFSFSNAICAVKFSREHSWLRRIRRLNRNRKQTNQPKQQKENMIEKIRVYIWDRQAAGRSKPKSRLSRLHWRDDSKARKKSNAHGALRKATASECAILLSRTTIIRIRVIARVITWESSAGETCY